MTKKTPRNHKLTAFLASIKLIKPLRRIDLFYVLNQEDKQATSYIQMLTKNGYLKLVNHYYQITRKAEHYLDFVGFELIHNKKKGYSMPMHNLALTKGLYHTLLNSNQKLITSIKKEKPTSKALIPDLTIQTDNNNFYFEIDTGTQGLKVVQHKIDRYKNTLLTDPKNRLIFLTKSKNNYSFFNQKITDVEFYNLDDKEFIFTLDNELNNQKIKEINIDNGIKNKDELNLIVELNNMFD